MESAARLAEYIKSSEKIVFFGGAGVSTESGIPDFRSVDGLYNMKYDYPPEEILSHDFFFRKTEEFYRFYRDKIYCPNAQPNGAHKALAALEEVGKLSAVVTQNIDGLHQAAGSKKVYELHGSIKRNYCVRCGKFYDEDFVMKSEGVPRCSCGALVKPDVVLYGEGLDDATVTGAVYAIADADLLIVAGTSLTVYPAAGFLSYYRGGDVVLINRDPTPLDHRASLIIRDPVGRVMEET
ncbi:MAG: NAD-dependent protein deacylase, partial [Clostridia bacterium]|nr:NAD-dependent protein deacylase [Clostridia bacterium]